MQHTAKTDEFWVDLEQAVTVKVRAGLDTGAARRAPLIAYLRDLEVMARDACDRRQTIQVIVSGRRLLGDHTHLTRTARPG